MAGDAKSMFPSYGVADALQFFTLKFDQSIALRTMQVVMLWISIIVFEHSPAAQIQSPQQSGLHQFIQRSIHRGAAHMTRLARRRQLIDQRLGIEMIMVAEDMIN